MDAITLRNERKQGCQLEEKEQRPREPGGIHVNPASSPEDEWPYLGLCLDTLITFAWTHWLEKADYFLKKDIPLGQLYFFYFFFLRNIFLSWDRILHHSLHPFYLLFLNLLCKTTQNRIVPLHTTSLHGIPQIGLQCSVCVKDFLPLWGTIINTQRHNV